MKMKKILLIEPPFLRFMGFKCDWFPLGLGYIASVLRANGYDVKIYNVEFHTQQQYLQYAKLIDKSESYYLGLKDDNHHIWKEVRSTIESYSPDVVGITVKSTKAGSAKKIAAICKSINPDNLVVAGGPHPSILPDQALNDKNIDFVVRGEGEFTFLKLLEALREKKSLQSIEGLSFRQDGKTVHNKNRELAVNLDEIPFPAKDALIDPFAYKKEAFGDIVTSRGCPFRCAYCAAHITWTRKVRYRSIANVIAEIKFLKSKYGLKEFMFWDDSFTLKKDRTIEFCRVLRQHKLKISWGCCTRFDLLDEEIIRNMRRAGCNNIELGVESGSPRIIELMKKDETAEKISSVVKLLRKYHIYWSGFFMVGLPTETNEDINLTLNFMKKLKPNYATFSVFTPLPGTELYELLVNRGAVKDNIDWNLYSYQSKNNNFTTTIANDEFKNIVANLSREFDANNKRLDNIFLKSLSRSTVYFSNPVEILKDAKNYLNYLGLIKK
jgi:radical SAM superfamily enzyme YgiQ (UPF0313 family)